MLILLQDFKNPFSNIKLKTEVFHRRCKKDIWNCQEIVIFAFLDYYLPLKE